jgi:predicted dienelactone hydrolase
MKTAAALLALAALVISIRAADAQDACLSGTSYLTDQRALVALVAATEVACPCASYTGGTGLGRAAFQKCAKGVLADAVDASALRAECEKTAKLRNKATTCGSPKVACGRVDDDASTPQTCRLKPAARCHDTARFEQNPCADETRCADVVDWTAGTCVDPRENGAYAAGARVITFTKPSVADPTQTRTLDTVIWYPAPAGSTPVNSGYNAVLNAPLDLSGGPYPLLLFSHGSCGYPLQSVFMTGLLASHGFIVVAPPHPGNTINEFPACGSPAAQVASAAERPQDMEYVLDQMLAANADSGSPFFGSIDPDRLGMSGHSFGGLTTFLTVGIDSRFKVAMPLAAATPVGGMLTIPSLAMFGSVDTYVNLPNIQTAYAASQSPKYLVEIKDAGHFAFSGLCFASPDCNFPTTLSQAEAHELVLRWVLPFLEVYLAGDTSFAPFLLEPAPPSVDFSAAP